MVGSPVSFQHSVSQEGPVVTAGSCPVWAICHSGMPVMHLLKSGWPGMPPIMAVPRGAVGRCFGIGSKTRRTSWFRNDEMGA